MYIISRVFPYWDIKNTQLLWNYASLKRWAFLSFVMQTFQCRSRVLANVPLQLPWACHADCVSALLCIHTYIWDVIRRQKKSIANSVNTNTKKKKTKTRKADKMGNIVKMKTENFKLWRQNASANAKMLLT